jgi:hypothetical protein
MRTSGSGESALLLLDVVDLLTAQKTDYAVIGALAASIHGAVRASMDADVVLSVGLREADALEHLFKASGFRTEMTRGDFEDPIPGLLKVSDSHGNRVDLLIGLRLRRFDWTGALGEKRRDERCYVGQRDAPAFWIPARSRTDTTTAYRGGQGRQRKEGL